MINQVAKRTFNILKSRMYFSSQVTKSSGSAPTKREYLQFSKSRLVEFGQLPFGEIPDALKYSCPTSLKKLSNGVRVSNEYWPGFGASINVTIKAGTRQENLSNSSVSQFISRLILKGTTNLSRADIQQKLDNFGGNIQIKVDRELTSFSLLFNKDQLSDAVAFLSELILRPSFDATLVQAEKPLLYKDATSLSNPEQISVENIHFTSFRDHYLGQPVTGVRDNIYSITPEQIKQFHQQFYVGENIIVSGAGDIQSSALEQLVGQHFGNVKAEVIGEVPNKQQPYFTPSLMFMRDDELPNTSSCVGFVAPSFNDPDFFAMSMFRRVIGQYRVDKFTGSNLNASHLQYNSFHESLGNCPDIIAHRPLYFAYSDTGLFVNFMFGNDVFNHQLALYSQNQMSKYAQYINQTQVFRARNRYWNELLSRNNPFHAGWANSIQIAYLDRIISRTEIATRISHMDPATLNHVATKWFWDKDISATLWGNLHNYMMRSHYHRVWRRSTLGDYSVMSIKEGY